MADQSASTKRRSATTSTSKPARAIVPGSEPVSASQLKSLYLTAYNFTSAVLWATVLGRTAIVSVLRGPLAAFLVVDEFLRWTQTLALLEVVHSVFGIVRAPLMTTGMQVASRLLLVWFIVYPFPRQTAQVSPFFATMVLAWSLTEVVRYSWFAVSLAKARAVPAGSSTSAAPPNWFTRLRYSTFLILYPIGISSEVRLIYLAAVTPSAAPALHQLYAPALYLVLAIYVPGSYILYTHMLAQRRKVLRRLRAEEEAAASKSAEAKAQ